MAMLTHIPECVVAISWLTPLTLSPAGILMAPVITMHAATPLTPDGAVSDSGSDGGDAAATGGGAGELSAEAAAARLEMARELVAAVEAYGLADCWNWKPLMDGKKVRRSSSSSSWCLGACG